MSAVAAARGVALYEVSGLGREPALLGDVRAFWILWRLFRRLRPQIVHTHTAKAGALGRVAALLAGVPVRVHTFHGHVFRGYFGRWRTAFFLTAERLLARITTKVVAISQRQAHELSRYLWLGPERITIVPLGLDLGHFVTADAAAARERFRGRVAAGDRVVATMVGRLTAIKNHALAFRALAQAVRRVPDLLLVLVGGGEEEAALRALARKLGIEDHVRFAGWWDDLEAVYYGSDVVALSSTNEGTPVCLIEALACGRPVIATDVGGVADVLADGEFGVIVPPDKESGFADALVRFANPVERAKRVQRGREHVLAHYGSARLVADIEGLYDDLLAKSGKSC
jgi:glycosyltransferase involved in cell wall biosynthesis